MPYLKLSKGQVSALLTLYDFLGHDIVELEKLLAMEPPVHTRTFGSLIEKGYVCVEPVGRWSDFKYQVSLTEKGLSRGASLKRRET